MAKSTSKTTKKDDAPKNKPDEGKVAEKGKPEAEKIDPNPVDVREPYPTGNPPDPDEQFRRIHGYDRPKE